MRKVDAAVLSQNILDIGLQGFDDTEETHNCTTQHHFCLIETATKSSPNRVLLLLYGTVSTSIGVTVSLRPSQGANNGEECCGRILQAGSHWQVRSLLLSNAIHPSDLTTHFPYHPGIILPTTVASNSLPPILGEASAAQRDDGVVEGPAQHVKGIGF
jgi:hypothetical protein